MIKSNGSNLLHNSSGKVTQSFGTQIKKKVGGGTTPKSSQINIDNNSMVKQKIIKSLDKQKEMREAKDKSYKKI